MVNPFSVSGVESFPKNISIGNESIYLKGRISDICCIIFGIKAKGINLPEKKNMLIPKNSNMAVVSSSQKAPNPIQTSAINNNRVDIIMAKRKKLP